MSAWREITPRQQQILDWFKAYVASEGLPPTIRETARHFKITVRGMYDHFRALERKHFLRKRTGVDTVRVSRIFVLSGAMRPCATCHGTGEVASEDSVTP